MICIYIYTHIYIHILIEYARRQKDGDIWVFIPVPYHPVDLCPKEAFTVQSYNENSAYMSTKHQLHETRHMDSCVFEPEQVIPYYEVSWQLPQLPASTIKKKKCRRNKSLIFVS